MGELQLTQLAQRTNLFFLKALNEVIAEIQRVQVCEMFESPEQFNAIVREIESAKWGEWLKVLYDFNGVIIEEESVDVLERDQVVDVAKSIVLQMQRFIELLALETLLIL